MKKAVKKWRRIADHRVVHVWKKGDLCRDCDSDARAEVGPDYYCQAGTPICADCGADMVYSHTEIKVGR